MLVQQLTVDAGLEQRFPLRVCGWEPSAFETRIYPTNMVGYFVTYTVK